jgi:hypothetical protein
MIRVSGGGEAPPVRKREERFPMAVTAKFDKTFETRYVGTTLAVNNTYRSLWDETLVTVHYWSGSAVDIAEFPVGQFEITVDATEDVVRLAREWLVAREYRHLIQQAVNASHTIDRGRKVKVIGGRKVAVGSVWTVKWYGETRFGWSSRLVNEATGEETWCDPKWLEVLAPTEEGLEKEIGTEVMAKAQEWADNFSCIAGLVKKLGLKFDRQQTTEEKREEGLKDLVETTIAENVRPEVRDLVLVGFTRAESLRGKRYLAATVSVRADNRSSRNVIIRFEIYSPTWVRVVFEGYRTSQVVDGEDAVVRALRGILGSLFAKAA